MKTFLVTYSEAIHEDLSFEMNTTIFYYQYKTEPIHAESKKDAFRKIINLRSLHWAQIQIIKELK